MPRHFYNPQLPRRMRVNDEDVPDSHISSSSASYNSDNLPIQPMPYKYHDKPTDFDPVLDAGVILVDTPFRACDEPYVSTKGGSDIEMTDLVEAEEEDFNASPQRSAEQEEDEYYLGSFSDEDPEEQTPTRAPLHYSSSTPPASFIPPASSCFSTNAADPTSAMPHHPKSFTMSSFTAALALYCAKGNISREQYSDLLSVFKTMENVPPDVSSLPTRVNTIKKTLDEQLPLLTLRSRELHLDQSLLPTRTSH